MAEVSSMLASDLFARSQGSVNNGIQNCHWCSAPCDTTWRHDDPPPIPFLKTKNQARCPANSFMCVGCWLWRRSRVTVFYLDNSYKDSQAASNHSWWITDGDARAITPGCQQLLQSSLLKPPNRFVLSIKADPTIPNHLHLAFANDVSIIEGNTPLKFTFNNIASEYTVYDLETALKDKDAVRTPGVRLLLSYFTPWEYPQMDKKRAAGKPPEVMLTQTTKKSITVSGNPTNEKV